MAKPKTSYARTESKELDTDEEKLARITAIKEAFKITLEVQKTHKVLNNFGLPLWLRVLPAVLVSLFFTQRSAKSNKPKAQASSLFRLKSMTDWVPSAAIRKRQSKLISDEFAEIYQFKIEGRVWLVRWRTCWAWVHWFRYLLTGPFTAMMKLIIKRAI